MEDKKLNEKESLELISRMIQNTQNKLEKGRGMEFITMGYITALISIVVGILVSQTSNQIWNLLWFGIPILGYPLTFFLGKKQERTTSTFIERVISYIWVVAFITMLIPSLLTPFTPVNILFIILLIAGMTTIITGLIIKFLPVIIGGSISLLLSIPLILFKAKISIFGMEGVHSSYIIFAVAFIVTMVIPSHILNYRGRKLKS